MVADEHEFADEKSLQQASGGRPRLGKPRRVRITTTIEPAKLAVLREHARKNKQSLGQLVDEYVERRFAVPERPAE